MRKIYDEYIRLPKEGEGVVCEKVFFTRLAISVVCIAMCMMAMGFNAYAYFTASISSSSNVIQTSTYETIKNVTSTISDTETVKADSKVKGKYTLKPGQYNFTLTKQGTASTGYCRIDVDEVIDNGTASFKSSFYTQQLGKVAASEEPVIERTILISVDKETVIQIVDCWGTYAGAQSNAGTYLNTDEVIRVKGGAIAKVNISEITIAPTNTEPSSSLQEQPKTEQPAQDNNTGVQQNNVDPQESGAGEQIPTETPQAQ